MLRRLSSSPRVHIADPCQDTRRVIEGSAGALYAELPMALAWSRDLSPGSNGGVSDQLRRNHESGNISCPAFGILEEVHHPIV
jgi:hypothetical protein